MQEAQTIVPILGDYKSYLEFLRSRIAITFKHDSFSVGEERPRLDSRGFVGLNRLIEKETDWHLKVKPWMAKAIEAVADHIAFQRLKARLPKLAKESPFIIIPTDIIESIARNHLADESGHPRYRELDEASLEAIDVALLKKFNN